MAKRRLINAINDALIEEMERDPKVILFGEDVKASVFGDTRGLYERFGPDRVRDTPISENALTGMAVGAAAAGYRVVLHLMFSNFMYMGFDGIANQASKLRYMSGGQVKLPMTVLAQYGGGRSAGAHHGDSPYPMLMNLGGINIAVPATAADAKGLVKTAIRGENPTFIFEAGGRGGDMGEVPDGDHLLEFGKAAIRVEGSDITLVAIGAMVKPAQAAALMLAEHGVSAEVIDCRTLVPLDEAALITSITKTGRLVVVDEARDRCSAASHIAALAADRGFGFLKGPVRRVTVSDVAIPYSPPLEKYVLPSAEKIAAAARDVLAFN